MPLFIRNNRLILTEESKELWSLNLSKIKLIGEYTTDQGPYLDDYFFVFAESENDLLQASNMQIEDSKFWTELNNELGSEVLPELFASTEWNTNIMYPSSIKGQQLFDTKSERNESRTFLQRLFGTGKTRETVELTETAKSVFRTGL